MTKLKRIPVVIRLYPQDIHKADLMRELRIDKHNLDRELIRQPARYAFWASLYSVVAAKVAFLQERLDNLEAKLFIEYARDKKARRVSDIKFHVLRNPDFQILKSKLRRWQDSERNLKYGMRGFEQRKDVLQTLAANHRREWNSDVTTKRRHTDD